MVRQEQNEYPFPWHFYPYLGVESENPAKSEVRFAVVIFDAHDMFFEKLEHRAAIDLEGHYGRDLFYDTAFEQVLLAQLHNRS